LGAAGIEVLALGPHPLSAGLRSRYATASAVGPGSEGDSTGFAERVGALAAEHGRLVVFPGQERSIDALLDAPSPLLERTVLPYGPPESLVALRDKRRLRELAEEVGLQAPKTVVEGVAADLLTANLSPPVMLKPTCPVGVLRNVASVDSEAELRAFLSAIPADEPLLVQERGTGPLTAVAVVMDREGGVAARFQQEATRTWPSGAGPSSLSVSVPPDHDLQARVARLLANAGYVGLAELQFVGTPGGPALIDINTRFYGSLPLALAAGINLPAVWHAAVDGEPTLGPQPYAVGVTYRWLEADLSAAFRGAPNLLFECPRGPRVGSMWASDDPVASVLLAASAAGVRLRRRLPTSLPA